MTDENKHDVDDTERERGILTSSDRKFLGGEKELSGQSKRDARYRIRKRIKQGLLDIAFLRRTISDKDRKLIADDLFPSDENGEVIVLRIISVIFNMILDVEDENIERAKNRFEDTVAGGIRSVINQISDSDRLLINVSVDINIRREEPDPDELLAKYQSGQESLKELQWLRKHDYISHDRQYHDHVLNGLWEQENSASISIPSEDGYEMYETSKFDNLDDFKKAVFTAIEDAPVDMIEE